jgi:hypothetical protein
MTSGPGPPTFWSSKEGIMRIGRMMMVVALGAFLPMGAPTLPDAHAASGAAFDGSTLAGRWHFHFEGTPAAPASNFAGTVAAFGWFTIAVSSDPNVLNVTGGKAWIETGIGVTAEPTFNENVTAGILRLRDADVGVYGLDGTEAGVIQIAGDGGNFRLYPFHIMLDDRRGQSGRLTGKLTHSDPSLFSTSVVSGTVTKE